MPVHDGNSNQDTQDDLYEHYSFSVDKGQEPLRIDKFLLNRIESISRNKIQQAAKAECILVGNKPVKSNYKVRPLDKISIVFSAPPHEYKLEPENIPLEIVYEDSSLVVINKPAGLVVHPGSGNYTGTLVNALLYHFGNLPVKDNYARPGLIHRLDKNTSGLMVVAKEDVAMTHLAKQFFDHTIERKYVAMAWGDFDEEEGTIRGNIGRNLRFRKKMAVFHEGDHGKDAITHYRVIERFGYVTLIQCQLETGRTHQIRVHMSSQGHPIFNDDTYGGDRVVKGTVYTKYKQFIDNCFKIIDRQALHAKILGFVHPRTKKKMHFESDLPQDFQNLVDKWRNYYQYTVINK